VVRAGLCHAHPLEQDRPQRRPGERRHQRRPDPGSHPSPRRLADDRQAGGHRRGRPAGVQDLRRPLCRVQEAVRVHRQPLSVAGHPGTERGAEVSALPVQLVHRRPGCMENGQDILITDKTHSYGISDRAIVDTADSLTALKNLVYDSKTLSMEEMLEALDNNFAGKRGEEIGQMCWPRPSSATISTRRTTWSGMWASTLGASSRPTRTVRPALQDLEGGALLALLRWPGRGGAA